ncbi:MAG: SRPBCC domain-containing protein [Aeromicrobium sp.]
MEQDAIERSIDIDAPAERVWTLVSEPGWWINGGTYRSHQIEHRDGVDLVTDEEHGTFPIVTQKLDPPHYAAFRWPERGDDDASGSGTTTEFWIDEREGGTTLRVRESGFSSLDKSAQDLRKHIDENTEGWKIELAVAKKHVEP